MLKKAVEEATSGDVAERIRKAVLEPAEQMILEQVSPSVLYQIDEAFGFPGTQDDPLREIADAVHESIAAALNEATREPEIE